MKVRVRVKLLVKAKLGLGRRCTCNRAVGEVGAKVRARGRAEKVAVSENVACETRKVANVMCMEQMDLQKSGLHKDSR